MNSVYKYKLHPMLVAILVSFSCTTDDPTIIQLPDKTPPSGYIVNPLDGSSVSGSTTLQVIAIDNEKVDTVFFMIKAQSAERYQSIDSTTNESEDIWTGNWDTRESRWIENENYFITFRAVDLVGNSYIGPPVIVKVDNQDDEAPTGYIKNPITGQSVNGLVDIEVEATDNTSVQYVSILINNDLKITRLTEPYSYQWNTEEEVDDLVYSIYAVIVDIDNNRTTIPPISVTVNNQLPTDVTPPTGALTSPPAGSTVFGNALIQVTAADDQLVDYIEFYIDGDLNGTIDCNGPSCTGSYEWNTLDESEGEHTIQVILVDGWNNTTVLTSVNVWVDNIDDDSIHPEVVIIEPASGQTVAGDVFIEALATDNSGIDRVEFFINADLTYIDSIGPDYNYTWITDTFPDDQDYIISLVAYDLVGNEGPSTPITIHLDNYDNISPSGSILYPYAGQSVSEIETISVYAEDNDAVSLVEFYIDNVLVYTDTEVPYEYDWDTSAEAEDLNHIVGAKIEDLSGNIFEVPSVSVYVNNIPNDTSPPIVVISSPTNGQTVAGTVNFTVLANDDSGISLVEFFIDGESIATTEEAPYTYLWDTTLGHNDPHALSARAVDVAGNISFAQPILVQVNN
tara:strand:- start:507 stop:2378 length:1872 start_codon:yes stop_codon:yes gene_type:complete